MAKNGVKNPQQAAAHAGVRGFARIRQMFSRNKAAGSIVNGVQEVGSRAAVGGAMAASSAFAREGEMVRAGVVTHAAVEADKAVQKAHGAISRVNNFVYYGSFIAGGLAVMGRLPLVGQAFEVAAKVAGSPREYMDKTTVREAVHAPSQALGAVGNAFAQKILTKKTREFLAEDGKLKLDALKLGSGELAEQAKQANSLIDEARKALGEVSGLPAWNKEARLAKQLAQQKMEEGGALASEVLGKWGKSAFMSEDGKLKLDALGDSLGQKESALAKRANALLEKAAKISAKENGVGGKLKGAAHKVFDPVGDLAGKVVGEETRGKLADRLMGNAAKHHGSAVSALDEVLGKSEGNEALSAVKETLSKAKDLLGDGGKKMSADDSKAFQDTLGTAKEKLAELTKDALDSKTLAGLKKSLQQAEDASGAFNQRGGMADKVRDLPGTIKNAPSALAGSNLTNVALKGAVVTGTALQVTSTARGVAEKVHTLKQMYCDLTGAKKISTFKLLTSKKVPALVKEARGHIMKEFGPRVVLNLANTVATYGFMKNSSKSTMLVSAGLMGASQLHSAKVQNYGLLPMYDAMSKSAQLSELDYASFIAAASKDAAKAGGVESQLVQALAVDYAREGVRPAEILKEIESGRFDERAVQKVEENRTAMEQAGGHQLAQMQAGKPVLGDHTQRLQSHTGGRVPDASQLRG